MKQKKTSTLHIFSEKADMLTLFSLLFIAYTVLMPKYGHDYDTWCWKDWASQIFTLGLKNTYKTGTDYLPLYHYILFLFGKFQGSIAFIERNIYALKAITLVFDFIAGYYLIKFLRTKYSQEQSLLYSFLFFFNIAYFYVSLIWGQVDGIMVCFIFIAFYYALKQQVLTTLIFILLSINLKLQAIIFMPLWGLLLFPAIVSQFSVKKTLIWIAIPAILQVFILLPFILANDLGKVWAVVTGSMGKYPVISMNADNFWSWVMRGDLMKIKDTGIFLGITHKHWGLILFFSSSFMALYPLAKNVFHQLFYQKTTTLELEKILITAALIPLLFFFFNTQMHERYVHPALIFLATYSILSRNFFPYILASIAYFLNLERVMHFLKLENYGTALFHPCFVAALFFMCMLYLFSELYEIKFYRKRDRQVQSLRKNPSIT